MEPVPETERMSEFRSSPVPTLRIHEAPSFQPYIPPSNNPSWSTKPPSTRRATDPTPSSPLGWGPTTVAYRPRNVSPYNRGHVRSHSAASTPTPPMSRAKSMPGVSRVGFFNIGSPARPSSPAGSPNRNRALRKPVDEAFPVAPPLPNRGLKIDTSDHVAIPEEVEEEEEEETPRGYDRSASPNLLPSMSNPHLRRSSSPSRNLSIHYPTSGATTPTSPSSITSSPLYPTSRYDGRYDSFNSYPYATSTSSVPTTPSSLRSRSPSISSLETIPDTPDAEEAALEAERIAQLKAAADAVEGEEGGGGGSDAVVGRGRKLSPGFGRDKSKRWSVCGAERRGDIDLETIWED
ncbi:hypothetical protein VE01_06878 [Pseudogymnoascus verrucosus]|uniref:Basic proline-rich protein n=1 Tax=Pseudogymnoascus verrucosus TaxID=342668 RepID=A0A1B8GJU9_9PEZI|nr:uncharacterized protein VE01_06878 [Pseudogymnoascus verrucosus]OBT96099.1 hypothetical protein VE01_06878 [Pseudogymnoascus verrucosus]